MRVSPIGLYADLNEVLRLAKLQASVTHDTPAGHMSASAIAAMVHYFVYRLGPVKNLGTWLEEKVPGFAWSEGWNEWVSVQGIPCAAAAITAVMCSPPSMTLVLHNAVAVGGDVDTVAAMAMFSAAAAGFTKDLNPALYENLEGGAYGYDYLKRLDAALDMFVIAQKNGLSITVAL
jgi:ADP-ribosyl-[dinitrogen reductase] hydrolase